jgi:hypothetical protein
VANPFDPPAPDDPYVADLVAAGIPKFKAELIAIKHRRIGAAPVAVFAASANTPVFANPFGEPAPPPDPNAKPPCLYGPRHVYGRYGRDGDGNVIGFCKCGYVDPHPPCPHKVQRGGRNKNVICNDCGKTLIGNTGFVEDKNQIAAARAIRPGTVVNQAPEPDHFRPS